MIYLITCTVWLNGRCVLHELPCSIFLKRCKILFTAFWSIFQIVLSGERTPTLLYPRILESYSVEHILRVHNNSMKKKVYKMLSTIFRMSKTNVWKCISTGKIALMESFVPENIGFHKSIVRICVSWFKKLNTCICTWFCMLSFQDHSFFDSVKSWLIITILDLYEWKTYLHFHFFQLVSIKVFN